MIRRGTFLCVEELEQAIYQWLAHWNQKPQPFVWKATRLAEILDRPASLWINSDHTKGPGYYDCMSEAEAFTLDTSLMLIEPETFSVEVGPHYYTGKRTWRAGFAYDGTNYNVSLTDPIAANKYAADGSYPLNDVYACVSLT